MTAAHTPSSSTGSLIIVADDLIWVSRLRAAAERAGAPSTTIRSEAELAGALAADHAGGVVIDLGGRAYDGVALVAQATAAGARVICVAQHEDSELRKAALAAGALRVFAYSKLFGDGTAVLARFAGGQL